MTVFQKVIKYLALAFAIVLAVSIIGGALGIVSLIGGWVEGGDGVAEKLETYAVSSGVKGLDIDLNAVDFRIEQAEAFYVESNLKHLRVEERNGVLIIDETEKRFFADGNAVLTIYAPADTVFERAEISTGAGEIIIDRLAAGQVDLDFGAGEAVIDMLIAEKSAKIDGGAGKITISGGAMHNLEADMGVGQLNLTSALTGKNEFDLGVGETNLALLGGKDSYALSVERGVGSVTVDGESVSANAFGNGENRVDIDGGVGAIHITFPQAN